MKILITLISFLFISNAIAADCVPGKIERTKDDPCMPERCSLYLCQDLAGQNANVECSPEQAMLIECQRERIFVEELEYCDKLKELFFKAYNMRLYDVCDVILDNGKQCGDWYRVQMQFKLLETLRKEDHNE